MLSPVFKWKSRAFDPILQAFFSCMQFPCRHVLVKKNVSKIQKASERMAQGKQQLKKLKEIHAITSEIIEGTDGRWMDFDFMSSADTVKQS